MKKLIIAVVALCSGLAFAAGRSLPGETHVNQPELKWAAPFGPQGPQFGFVEGTMGDKNPASFFVKFPAGGDSGWHVHDEDYQAVVVQGNFTEQQQGEASETVLPPGTYLTQTGKHVHRNGCAKEGGDCLVFVHFNKGANSFPTTPDGKRIAQAAGGKVSSK